MAEHEVALRRILFPLCVLAILTFGSTEPAHAQAAGNRIHGQIRGVENETVLVQLADTITVAPGTTGRVVRTRTVGGQNVTINVARLRVRRIEQIEEDFWGAWCQIVRQSQRPQSGDDVRFEEVQPRPGRLVVQSQPAEATVFLNGTRAGTTPLRQQMEPGRHELRVEAENHRAVTQSIRIRAAQEQRITVSLAEVLRATLAVDTDPKDAVLYVNEERLGTTPTEHEVAPGSLRIRLEKDHFRTETRRLTIAPGERRALSVALQGLPGTLNVRSTPDGATVIANEDTLGTTPLTESLAPGSYDVRLRKEEFEAESRRLEISPDEQRVLSVTLQPARGTLAVTSLPDNATVTLHGDTLGTTPLTEEIQPGTYQLHVQREGYISSEPIVRVRSGEEAQVNVSLRRPLHVQMADVQDDEVGSASVTRDGDRLVITYDLTGEDDAYTVDLLLSTNGGRTFEPVDATARGAVGEDVTPGSGKHVVWAVLEDLPEGLSGEQNRLRLAVESQGGNRLLWIIGGALAAGASSTIAVLVGGGDGGGGDGGGLPTPPVPPGN